VAGQTRREQVIHMRNVEPGFRVVGSDGTEVGTVARCARQYCEVTTGLLGLGSPLYVPMDAIRQTEGNTVYLNVPSDRLGEMNWSQPPAGVAEGCPTGYYGPMPIERPAEVPTAAGPAAPTAPAGELTPAALALVQRGWPIICAEGREVGKVASVRPDGLIMERGWFIFRYRSIVPARAIRHVDDVQHRVYLGVSCREVDRFESD
jgi:hypothetical protein